MITTTVQTTADRAYAETVRQARKCAESGHRDARCPHAKRSAR